MFVTTEDTEITESIFFSVPSVFSVVKENPFSFRGFMADAGSLRYPQERAGRGFIRYQNP